MCEPLADLHGGQPQHGSQVCQGQQDRALGMVKAMFNNACQAYLEPCLPCGGGIWVVGQVFDIFGQQDRPSQRDQFVIARALAGMGFTTAGSGAGEYHPTTAQVLRRRIELVGQFLRIFGQGFQDPTASQQAVIAFQQVDQGLLKGAFDGADVCLAHFCPLFSGWEARFSRCNWFSSRSRQAGLFCCW